jgi:phosphatidylserine/phosphatidylglycerophosphate/cardiolipin synthase-like enzyme
MKFRQHPRVRVSRYSPVVETPGFLAAGAFLVLSGLMSAALAARPACGDAVCNGGEVCDGTSFCGSTSCPAGTAPVCNADCKGYTCQPTGGGSGTLELLFTNRSDDVSETNISPEEQRLLDLLDNEAVSIKASIDDLSRSNVVDRLISAHQRGVSVQVTADCEIVVVDNNPYYQQLMSAGIPVVDDNNSFDGPSVTPGCTSSQTSGFVHNKFLIFGGQQTVWTGSTNLTDFGFNASENSIVIISGNSQVVDFYQAEFNEMFGNGLSLRAGGTGKFGQQKTLNPGIGSFNLADGTKIEIAFSPYNHNTTSDTEVQMNKTIDSAASELMWTTFYLTYDPITSRIDSNGAASKRGAVDPLTTNGYNNTQTLINNGEQVLVTNFLGSHHWKMVIADPSAADGQVLVGSHNFSSSSFNYNNENSVRILSPTFATTAKTEFEAVWNDPQNAGLVGCIHSGESFNQNSKPLHRCNDNYDNDFDGATDGADTDCAGFFTCAASSCKASGAACSSGSECCSGTCLHGKIRTCQ